MPSEKVVRFGEEKKASPVFVIPPIEGTVILLTSLVSKLSCPVYGLQCTNQAPLESIQTLAQYYVDTIKSIQPQGPYRLIGYSFGACVALEVALQLKKVASDKVDQLVLLDGSHTYVLSMIKGYSESLGTGDSNQLETAMVCAFVDHIVRRLDVKVCNRFILRSLLVTKFY